MELTNNLWNRILYTAVSLSLLRLIYIYVIRFFFRYRFYSAQGIKLQSYWPIVGYVSGRKLYDQTFNGEPFFYMKQVIAKDPTLKVFGTNHMGNPLVYLLDPGLVKEHLIDKQSLYVKEHDYLQNFLDFFGYALIFAEGDKWRVHRKIGAEAFRFDKLKGMLPVMKGSIDEHLGRVIEQIRRSSDHTTDKNFSVMSVFTKITSSLICCAFFGEDIQNLTHKGRHIADLSALMSSLSTQAVSHPLWYLIGDTAYRLPLRKRDREIKNAKDLLMDFGRHIIAKRRAEGNANHQDLLQLLLNQLDEKGNQGMISDDDVVGVFLQLLYAGTDTTSHALCSCIYYLCKNPQYMDKIREEARECLRIHNNEYTADCLNSMNFTQAVLKETLRLVTPAGENFLRKAIVDHQLGPYNIKKGTVVNVPLAVVGCKDPNVKDWNEFRPERWLGEEHKHYNMLSVIPFSAGSRNCLGQYLAMLELKMVLSEFLRLFSPKLDPSYKFGITFDFVQGPRMPMPISLTLNESSQ